MDKIVDRTNFSLTLREIIFNEQNVLFCFDQYTYSRAPCHLCGLPCGTTIGIRSSLAKGMTILRRNHPMERLSPHPSVYSRMAGLQEKDKMIDASEDAQTSLHLRACPERSMDWHCLSHQIQQSFSKL